MPIIYIIINFILNILFELGSIFLIDYYLLQIFSDQIIPSVNGNWRLLSLACAKRESSIINFFSTSISEIQVDWKINISIRVCNQNAAAHYNEPAINHRTFGPGDDFFTRNYNSNLVYNSQSRFFHEQAFHCASYRHISYENRLIDAYMTFHGTNNPIALITITNAIAIAKAGLIQ